MNDQQIPRFSREFFARRMQSLAGFVFLLFLCEHLLTNSQAALFFGEDGRGFIESVNFIHSLPYLPVIEISLIGLPIALHAWWGIERIFTAKSNSKTSDGATPALPYPRNRAYTWQRITSWLLLVAIALHVGYMRFAKLPVEIPVGDKQEYLVALSEDPGLPTVAARLNMTLYSSKAIQALEKELPQTPPVDPVSRQAFHQELHKIEALKREDTGLGKVVAVSDNIGTAFLVVLRESYKSIWLCSLYSFFVLIASFHACNGLWTFTITWGITLSESSRLLVRLISTILMVTLAFLGLICIWGVYWINLRY